MTTLTFLLGLVLGFATHWAYCEIARWWRRRAIDRAVLAFAKQEERVVSGIREMQR